MSHSVLPFAPDSVHRTRLPNGLTVLIRRDTTAPVAAVVTWVKAGYFDETDEVSGISHVLEHMFFKGTPSLAVGEIAKRTKASGGYLNAATIYDHTSYYAVLPKEGFYEGLRVQADAWANSSIDADELRRELEVIIEEAKRKADSPGAVAMESLFALLHDRHRIRRWRIGREAGLRGLTRENVLHFYRAYYQPSNAILAIVGDVDVDEALRHVELLYGSQKDTPVVRDVGPDEVGAAGRRYEELHGDVSQSHILMGWRTPGTLHRDTPSLDALSMVLSGGRASRLYRAVRDRRLATSATAFNYTPTALGVFIANVHGDPQMITAAAGAMWRQLRAVASDQPVTDSEVDRVRRLFETRLLQRMETVDGQATWLAEAEALGGWQLGEQYIDRFLNVSSSDVSEVATRYLDPDQMSVLVYRPTSEQHVASTADGALALLENQPGAELPPSAGMVPVAAIRSLRVSAERHHGPYHLYRTAGGVPIVVYHRPHAPMSRAGVYVAGGVTQETESNVGITALMARSALRGTAKRSADDLALSVELLGAGISPGIGADAFGWSVSASPKTLARAISLLAEVVQQPTFSDEAVSTERRLAQSALRQLQDDMYRFPAGLAASLSYEGHRYAVPIIGTYESLERLSASSVRTWHREVVGGSVLLAAVSSGDPDEIASLLAAAFDAVTIGATDRPRAAVWPEKARQLVVDRDKAQSAIYTSFPGPLRTDPDAVVGDLLVGITSGLGGRFFDELRERQSLAYTVHSSQRNSVAGGHFAAYIATSPEKENAAREGLRNEIDKLQADGITDDELARVKTYALGTYAIARQSGDAVLSELVDAWLCGDGLEELDATVDRIQRVTSDDVLRFARTYLDWSRRVEGIVRGRKARR